MFEMTAKADVVKIDYERVPAIWQERTRFIAIRAQINKTYSDPNLIQQIAVHEAAHAIYLEKAGTIGIRFFGPKILFDITKADPFDFENASVQGSGHDGKQTFDIAWVLRGTKACLAGGIAVRELTRVSDGGESGDIKRIEAFFEKVSASGLLPEFNADETTKKAYAELRKEIKELPLQAEIWTKVGEVIPIICRQ
jgi:hypothetical protein